MPQIEVFASKSAGHCLYAILWDYNIIYKPMGRSQKQKIKGPVVISTPIPPSLSVQNESKIANSL